MSDFSYTPASRETLESHLQCGRDLGKLVYAQYEGFQEAGFSKAQALHLATTWMQCALTRGEETDDS